jgi:hypothetical protein
MYGITYFLNYYIPYIWILIYELCYKFKHLYNPFNA